MVLAVLVTGFGITSLVLMWTSYAGSAVMEWSIGYLGSFWLMTFAGYIRLVEISPLSLLNVNACLQNATKPQISSRHAGRG